MSMTNFTVCIIILLIFIHICKGLVEQFLSILNRKFLFQRLIELYTVFDNTKESAFKSIHKQHISVIYTSRLSGPEKKDLLKKYEEMYIKRVVEMCGESIIEDLAIVSGSTDTIILDISNFYSEKIIQLETGDFVETDVSKTFGIETDDLKQLNI